MGIQSFEKIRLDGYLYVDKTALIHRLITTGVPYFLNRPRRFGKSLLISTLQAVFEGRRELFEAFTTEDGIEQPQLAIARTNWRWEKYPVLRFDFSKDIDSLEDFDIVVSDTLHYYEQLYGIGEPSRNVSMRMIELIRTAHERTAHRVVILCDEYDSVMLHSLGNPQRQAAVRQRFQALFSPIKEMDDHIQLVFITGISKFSQMGIFSKLNNLENISMQPQYEALCGISEEELTTTLRPEIESLAERNRCSFDDMLNELKHMYDGYHFSQQLTDMYNPFSLIYAFKSGLVTDYWFASGTTRALIDMLSHMPRLEVTDIDGVRCQADAFDDAFDSYSAPLPVLYQSGYLTIKDYDERRRLYTLGLPNEEVRRGFANCLYRYVTDDASDATRQHSQLLNAYYDFEDTSDLPRFIEALQAFFAGVPYLLNNPNERHYHALLYTLFMAFGADVVPEEMTARGRADLVLRLPQHIYIIELKYDGTAQEALDQIALRGYARKYAADGRPVTCIGLSFKRHRLRLCEADMKQDVVLPPHE